MSSSTASVSRETIDEKFAAYLALLNKWQPTVNLVGVDTLPDAKIRHFDDSIQLAEFIPAAAKTLYDWGSGAGFPGLVLAMLRPDLQVTLVESDQRKCAFLRTVSRETKSPVKILDDRIGDITVAKADVITARALAPLKELLAWALPWVQANPDVILLFHKGEKAEEEIGEARKKYGFNLLKHPSKTAPNSAILQITGLCISTGS
jgi:16S rRNA (guanine527-N7)-methyltransferase